VTLEQCGLEGHYKYSMTIDFHVCQPFYKKLTYQANKVIVSCAEAIARLAKVSQFKFKSQVTKTNSKYKVRKKSDNAKLSFMQRYVNAYMPNFILFL
jgi:hypothetical protein